MYAGMTFQVKRIVEAFSTEGTQVPFRVTVAFKMAVKQTLQGELLLTELADVLG